jgi:hypothetical protein
MKRTFRIIGTVWFDFPMSVSGYIGMRGEEDLRLSQLGLRLARNPFCQVRWKHEGA